jgi:hypothetical protein
MKRRFVGLNLAEHAGDEVPGGLHLVEVSRAQYRWHARKRYYSVWLSILEPKQYRGRSIIGRLDCTTKATWKLSWFLRDFGYDSELFEGDEIDEKTLVGLRGIVKINRAYVRGVFVLNLDNFAPAGEWTKLNAARPAQVGGSRVAS